MRRGTRLSLLWLPIFFGLIAYEAANGQQAEPASSKVAKQESPGKQAPAKRTLRGRLPAYFAAVVTRKQREEIYRIQARLQDEIDLLRQQINDLETARAEEVDAVLQPEQMEEVKKKRIAADERRRARSNPGGEKPPSPPAD